MVRDPPAVPLWPANGPIECNLPWVVYSSVMFLCATGWSPAGFTGRRFAAAGLSI